MSADDLLSLVSRWFHILPAVILVGGSIFMWLVETPSLATLSAADQREYSNAVRAHWARLVMLTTAFLLITGLYNTGIKSMRFQLSTGYNVFLLVKILLALAVFALSALLSGKSSTAQKIQQDPARWLRLNCLLAIALVCVGGAMRQYEAKPRPPKAAESTEEPAAK